MTNKTQLTTGMSDEALCRELRRKLRKTSTRIIDQYLAMISHNPKDVLGMSYLPRGSEDDPELSSLRNMLVNKINTTIKNNEAFIESYIRNNYKKILKNVLDDTMYEHAVRELEKSSVKEHMKE